MSCSEPLFRFLSSSPMDNSTLPWPHRAAQWKAVSPYKMRSPAQQWNCIKTSKAQHFKYYMGVLMGWIGSMPQQQYADRLVSCPSSFNQRRRFTGNLSPRSAISAESKAASLEDMNA